MVVAVLLVSSLEEERDGFVATLEVLDDRSKAAGTLIGLRAAVRRPADEHGSIDIECAELRSELSLSPVALVVKMEPALSREEKIAREASEPPEPIGLDDQRTHDVPPRSDALVDVGVQAAHASAVPKIWLATVLAASASRVGLTWL